MIAMLVTYDTVVVLYGAWKTSDSDVATLAVEWLTDVVLAVTLVVVTAEKKVPVAVDT